MKILALKFYDNGFMTESFAFGGTRDKNNIKNIRYKSSLQNFLIDDGNEVILIDTGLPCDTPDFKKDENANIFMGDKINTFKEAFDKTGYKISDVKKIIITHKHPDHTGEIKMFSDAKIYISRLEADQMKLEGDNIIKVDFTAGKFYNFLESERITPNLIMIKAPGHTLGNSIVILDDQENGLFYLFHGDITYCDAALKNNELSVVFEDKDKALDTLSKVRDFIKNNKTIYCSTHCPEGYLNLENKIIQKL